MPDKNGTSSGGEGSKGNSSGGGPDAKRKRNRGGKNKSKNSENSSTSSSLAASIPKSNEETKKIVIKKREPPLIASVITPLMTVKTNPTPYGHYVGSTFEKQPPTSSMNGRGVDVNNQQRHQYYFSSNAGSAVSAEAIKPSQWTRENFPLEQNVNTLVDKKFSLMITPTTSRCNGLYIRVKSQHSDEYTTGVLLKLDSDEKAVRKACREAMDNLDKVAARTSTERAPFSKCSEAYLKSCCIRRLDNRLDTFPEAIYYCEMCDYHINTINHAKSHLESSTHFDDLKRKQQRLYLLKKVESPTGKHLKSLNKVLMEVLEEYKQVQQKGAGVASSILNYLKTDVFPSLGCPDVTLKPFGSSTYDVVLSDSDYNVAYTMELQEGTQIFSFLEKVRRKIVDDGHPADHSMEMGTPSTIIFNYEGVRVRLCWMSCFSYRSQLYLSSLMKTYVDLRKEVVQFLQLIRLWASKAGVDSKNKPHIGLPRYGFDLMAIHFLQKQHYLPILHEMYDKKNEDPQEAATANPDEDSEKLREAGRKRIIEMSRYEKDIETIKSKFDMTKPWNMADLFVKFFRYYVEQHRDIVIQVTQSEPMSRDQNRWNKKIIHVVDPFRGDNVLSIPKVSTWQPFYFNCLLTTFLSLAIPRTVNGPILEVPLIHNKTASLKKKVPQTPKPSYQTPSKVLKSSDITDKQYQDAADERAEEQEHEERMRQLLSRTTIDGIKYANRKPENVDIDDHWHCVYSSKALKRFKRVLPCNITEKMALSIEEYTSSESGDLLTKKSKAWIKRWRKNKPEPEVASETEGAVVKSDEAVLEVTKEMEEKLHIGEANGLPEETVTSSTDVEDKVSSEVFVVNQPDSQVSCTPAIVVIEETAAESPEIIPEVSTLPEAPQCLGAETDENTSLKSSIAKEPTQKQTATFVNAKVKALVEKQICLEEFYIKDDVDFTELARAKSALKADDYRFEFSTESFSGGFEMEMKCTHCDGSHCVENCPMMEIPPILKFEARTPQELKDIDDIIDKYYEKNIMKEERMKQMEVKKNQLEKFLQENYKPDVTLTIFGSVMSGLSVNCSDIDICLRFRNSETPPKNRTAKDVILETERALRECKLVKRLQAIVTAKVPIVKFQMRLANGEVIDADISYYNVLAIHNTRLLKEYTFWTPDNRFAKLALFVKRWANSCDIGDASKGSLSSYAHIILLISYLQNCDPPVLPRLQEDFRSNSTEKRIVENWDTSFAEVEETLQKTWPKNKESCAQLLIGYFDYYSRFDFRNFVVQCRREMTLSKMEKDWPRPICVEDPFDLSHNLSSGVTKKMFVFIMKVFINSRAVFMSERPIAKRDINFCLSYEKQLLDKCNQGSAPTDRQCHNCHKIGHFYESCPQRAQGKDARRRFGSTSTSTSYRSNDGYNYRGSDDPNGARDSVGYFKRSFFYNARKANNL